MIDRGLHQVGRSPHVVVGLVEPARRRYGKRLVGAGVERGAAVERRKKIAVLIVELDGRVFAIPRQRRRDQRFATAPEIAPVVLVDAIGDEAIGQPVLADRTGDIEHPVGAALAAAIGRAEQGDRTVLIELGTLADRVDDAAGIHDAIEQRSGPFQHLDAFDGGIEAAALNQRHAVAHDRAVAVIAEATPDDGVLGAGERVGLGDAADIDERVVDVARQLILQHLLRHDVDDLRGVERRCAGAQRGRARHRAIAELGFI